VREFYDINMHLLDIKVGDRVICYGSRHHADLFKPGDVYKVEEIAEYLVVRHHTNQNYYTGLTACWEKAPTKFDEKITDWL